MSSSNHPCELVLMRISLTGATLSMIVVSFPMKSEYAQLMSVNLAFCLFLGMSPCCHFKGSYFYKSMGAKFETSNFSCTICHLVVR